MCLCIPSKRIDLLQSIKNIFNNKDSYFFRVEPHGRVGCFKQKLAGAGPRSAGAALGVGTAPRRPGAPTHPKRTPSGVQGPPQLYTEGAEGRVREAGPHSLVLRAAVCHG